MHATLTDVSVVALRGVFSGMSPFLGCINDRLISWSCIGDKHPAPHTTFTSAEFQPNGTK